LKKELIKAFYILFAGEYAGEYAGKYGYEYTDKNIGIDSSNIIDNNSPINTVHRYKNLIY